MLYEAFFSQMPIIFPSTNAPFQLDETVIHLILEVNALKKMGLLKYIKTKLVYPAKAPRYPRESEKWLHTENK